MNTYELINALTADHAAQPRPRPLALTLAQAAAAGALLSVPLFAATLGVRPDIASAVTTWSFNFKFVVTLTLAATASHLALRLSRPGAAARHAFLALMAVPALMLSAVAYELYVWPPSLWLTRMAGQNPLACLSSIPMLSLAPLAAVLIALRRGAPSAPGLAGAAAGLAAGGIGAALYAAHCPDDSPLFGAVWYTIAIGTVTAAGLLAGRRMLRW